MKFSSEMRFPPLSTTSSNLGLSQSDGTPTVPEVIVAAHMGISVLAISCVTNLAAGISPVKLSHKEVMETGERVRGDLTALLKKILPRMAS